MHFRPLLAFSAAYFLFSPMQAQTQDPTFNGLAKVVHCYMSTNVMCTGPNMCAVINSSAVGPGENMWISLADKRAAPQSPISGPSSVPIEILEVSPPAFNSTLHVKFGYPKTDKAETTGFLLFFPRPNGGFEIRYGQTADIRNPTGSPAFSRVIAGGTCDIQNVR